MCLRRVAQTDVDGKARADTFSRGEDRHHCESLQQRALAAALLADNNQLWRLPSFESLSKDIAQEIKLHAELVKASGLVPQ